MKKKTISLLIFICFLTVSINQCMANPEPLEDPTPLCYGFIVPMVRCRNGTIENQINCKIRHLINDLLREQIPVFWASTNLTAFIQEINDSEGKEMFFEKGTFVVPFTENTIQDTKLIAVIYDYNHSSEIEENNMIKTPVYLLMESLNIQVYPLSEVKIAQHKSIITSGDGWYVEVARKCGFLTFELLEDRYLAEKLDNSTFNVIMRPGGDMYYKHLDQMLIGCVLDLSYKGSKVIRDFISNGGGYIGSCGGTIAASCGLLPLPIYLKRRAYNPRLRSLGFLAIADILTAYLPGSIILPDDSPGERQQHIVNDTHPVTYGVDKVLINGTLPGPNIVHIGKNVQVIAVYRTNSAYDGTPSWVSSRFGSGKAVLFCGHPEIRDLDTHPEFRDLGVEDYCNGKKIISNALYYTTSRGLAELQILHSRNLSFIREVKDETLSLTIDTNVPDIFDEIKNYINETISEITNLTNELNTIQGLIRQIAHEKNIDINESPSFLYYGSTRRYMPHKLGLFIEYFENATKTLDTLEKIYPLLENDTEFVQQIEALKDDLSLKIDKARSIILKSLDIGQDYENLVVRYQNNQKLSKFQENKITKKGHDLEKQIEMGFIYIPQTYFNSLKFLRHHWYKNLFFEPLKLNILIKP